MATVSGDPSSGPVAASRMASAWPGRRARPLHGVPDARARGRARTCMRSPCGPKRTSSSAGSAPALPNQCGTRVSNSATSPGFSDEVVLAEQQPEPAAQHVHPLVALVASAARPRVLPAGISILKAAEAARPLGQRDDRAPVPLTGRADPRITRRRGADELVQRHLVRAGQRQQQLQGRPAPPGLQPGQRAHRDAGRLGELGQRGLAPLAERAQPRPDSVEHRVVVVP